MLNVLKPTGPLQQRPVAAAAAPTDPRRWTALVIIALAQLMVPLDATIMNVALPSAQGALHFGDAQRQFVITAYTLAFGGLLLLGGRIADYLGRKRAFLIGVTGFAAASALGGSAPNLGDGERGAAARRLDRYRAPQHHRGERDGRLSGNGGH